MAQFAGKFASVRSDWETPDWLFQRLDDEFHFDCDVAADADNAKVIKYINHETDALSVRWSGRCWLNPPYGEGLGKWAKKAWQEACGGALVVMLIPARTNTTWWHDYCMKAKEIRFLRGRPKFGNAKHGLPQPLAIVILYGYREHCDSYSTMEVP